jgi:hypothetical protein
VAIERLAEEIKRLNDKQRKELFKILGIELNPPEKRGGPEDPFSRMIGKVKGPKTGSQKYKEDLYGGKAPL